MVLKTAVLILAELVRNDMSVQAYLLSVITDISWHWPAGWIMLIRCCYYNGWRFRHPPELVPDLLRLWEDGNEIVQTIRLSIENVSFMKRFRQQFTTNSSISCSVEIPRRRRFQAYGPKSCGGFSSVSWKSALYQRAYQYLALGFKVAKVELWLRRVLGTIKVQSAIKCAFCIGWDYFFSNLPLRWAFYCGVFCGLCKIDGFRTSVSALNMLLTMLYQVGATMTASVLFLEYPISRHWYFGRVYRTCFWRS